MVEKDPAVSVYFSVTIGSKELGTFSSCEGLGVEVVLEQREEGGFNGQVWQLPTRLKYTNVKLSRPLGPDTTKIVEWFASMTTGVKRRHGHDRGERTPRTRRWRRGTCRASSLSAGPGPASTSNRRRWRRRRSRSPTTASCRPERVRTEMAAEVDRPARRPCRRVQAGAAPPNLTHAALEVYEATPAGARQRARRADRPDPVPVQPEGTVDLEVGELERGRTHATRRPRHAGVQRRRPLQADLRDVLRRHRHHGRQRRVAASSSCSPAACRPTTACRRSGLAPAGRPALGQRHELRRLRHVRAGQVHAVHRRGHADPRRLQRVAWRRCPATRSSRTRRRAASR